MTPQMRQFLDKAEDVMTPGTFLAHEVLRNPNSPADLKRRARWVIDASKEATKAYEGLSREEKREWQREPCGNCNIVGLIPVGKTEGDCEVCHGVRFV